MNDRSVESRIQVPRQELRPGPEEWERLYSLFQGDKRPFTVPGAAKGLHLTRRMTIKGFSDLTSAGWLIPIGPRRFIPADPTVRSEPEVETALQRFMACCFYPLLHLAVGEVLRSYEGNLTGIILFGSAARESEGPSSDVDLLVIGPKVYGRAYNQEAGQQAALVERALFPLVGRIERIRGHRHSLHITTLPTRLLDSPYKIALVWELARDAIVLHDPDFQLRAYLMRYRDRDHRIREYRIGTTDGRGDHPWGEALTILPDRLAEALKHLRDRPPQLPLVPRRDNQTDV